MYQVGGNFNLGGVLFIHVTSVAAQQPRSRTHTHESLSFAHDLYFFVGGGGG